jgi:hypothetical protein
MVSEELLDLGLHLLYLPFCICGLSGVLVGGRGKLTRIACFPGLDRSLRLPIVHGDASSQQIGRVLWVVPVCIS